MKKNIKTLIIIFVAILVILITYIIVPQNNLGKGTLFENIVYLTRSLVEVTMILGWCNTISKRIMNKKVAHYLICTGVSMALWFSVRIIKYCFLPGENFFHRFCWYSYYIAMILIPLFGVFITDYIGKSEDYIAKNKKKFLYIPASILIAMNLTNDLHQLVFSFPKGIEYYDTVYSYGIFQYLNFVWIIGLGLYFVLAVIFKSRAPGRKSFKSLPLFTLLLAVAFWISYALFESIRDIDLVAIDCLMIIGLLEGLIWSGQIRSNINYENLFSEFSLPIWIVDNRYNIIYKSKRSKQISHDLMKKSEVGSINLGDFRLHNKKLNAGRVVWETDIKELNSLIEELKYTEREISDENNLLNSEIVLKEQKAHYEEQNKLFDRISEETRANFKKIEELCLRAEEAPYNQKELLSKISFIGAYIKRRSNLLILSYENSEIEGRELELCFKESADNLSLTSAIVSFNAECSGKVHSKNAILVYDISEKIMEANLDNLNAVICCLKTKDGNIFLRLNLGLDSEFADPGLGEFENIKILKDDYDTTVEITLSGGEAI